MRIDFTYGTEANQIDHLPSEIAAILLGRNVSRKTFGSDVNWIYIVTLAKPGKKKPKVCWRWPKSRSTHLVVENDFACAGDLSLREIVIGLLGSIKNAIQRVATFLGEKADFDNRALIKAIDKTISDCPSDTELLAIKKNREHLHVQRMGDVMFGYQAYRALKKHECHTSLCWIRAYEATSAKPNFSKSQKQQLSIVGAMLGAALRRKITTPGYSEIFINFGFDETAVRSERCALEDWCENAYAVLPESAMKTRDDAAFRQLALESATQALREMAKHENIDFKIMPKLINEIDVVTLETIFELDRATNGHLTARIEYDFANRKDYGAILQPLFRLTVENSSTGKQKTFPLGPADLWKMERIFSKIVIKPKAGKIEVVATPASGAKNQTFDISGLL